MPSHYTLGTPAVNPLASGGLNLGGQGGGLGGLGALGATNPYLAAAMAFGPPLLQGLGSLIGGPSRSQRANRALLGQFQGQLNAPPPDFLNINRVFQDLQAGLRPEFSRQAQNLSSRLGISSPLAQAGLAQLTSSSLANIRGGLQQQLAQLQLQNLMSLRRGAVGAAAGV
jgi:hypothetical protein